MVNFKIDTWHCICDLILNVLICDKTVSGNYLQVYFCICVYMAELLYAPDRIIHKRFPPMKYISCQLYLLNLNDVAIKILLNIIYRTNI